MMLALSTIGSWSQSVDLDFGDYYTQHHHDRGCHHRSYDKDREHEREKERQREKDREEKHDREHHEHHDNK